jgi:hypothetical protein
VTGGHEEREDAAADHPGGAGEKDAVHASTMATAPAERSSRAPAEALAWMSAASWL